MLPGRLRVATHGRPRRSAPQQRNSLIMTKSSAIRSAKTGRNCIARSIRPTGKMPDAQLRKSDTAVSGGGRLIASPFPRTKPPLLATFKKHPQERGNNREERTPSRKKRQTAPKRACGQSGSLHQRVPGVRRLVVVS